MAINEQLIEYLAELSKLELDDNEKRLLTKQMSDIISLMDSIGEADIEETLIDESMHLRDLREDIPRKSLDRKELLKNAAMKNDEFFVVPKMIE